MRTVLAFRVRPLLVVLLTAFLLVSQLTSSAQCVLCSTQVEAARQEHDGYEPGGLNKGILYLMTIPYLLVGAVGFLLYRRRSRGQALAGSVVASPRRESTAQSALYMKKG